MGALCAVQKQCENSEAEAMPLEDHLSDGPENRIVVGCELDRASSQLSGSEHGSNSLEVHQQAAVGASNVKR